MELHHIGVVTADAVDTAARLTAVLGVRQRHQEERDGMAFHFLEFTNGYFELIEPLEPSPLMDFLDTRGQGIHHVAFKTTDIAGRLAHAADLGVRLLDESPRRGAWGHDIAFLHPKDTEGILVEYVSAESGH